MNAKKFRVVPCLLFALAALLTVASARRAQAQTAVDESATSAPAAPTVSRFHFTDKGDDIAGRMTTDAAGNFPQGNALHVLTVAANGTLSEGTDSPLFLPTGIPAGADPQGVAVIAASRPGPDARAS